MTTKTNFILKTTVILAVVALMGFCSCTKEVEENGLTRKINNMISPEILRDIEKMGMPIYRGGNPPDNITGEYLISPDMCKVSNRPDDNWGPGHQFSDYYVRFENQNNKTLSVDITLRQAMSEGEGGDACLVGSGNKFSVFVKSKGKILGLHRYETVDIYSGILEEGGIRDLHHTSIMMKGGGVAYNLIENHQCRIAFDADGFSEKEAIAKKMQVKENEIPSSIVSIP